MMMTSLLMSTLHGPTTTSSTMGKSKNCLVFMLTLVTFLGVLCFTEHSPFGSCLFVGNELNIV